MATFIIYFIKDSNISIVYSFIIIYNAIRYIDKFIERKHGNVIVGQSGAPTAVINSSLAGVFKTARDRSANKVFGMQICRRIFSRSLKTHSDTLH